MMKKISKFQLLHYMGIKKAESSELSMYETEKICLQFVPEEK